MFSFINHLRGRGVRTNLHDLYSTQRTLPPLIEEDNSTPSNIDEYYVKLKIIRKSTNNKHQAESHSTASNVPHLAKQHQNNHHDIDIENIFKDEISKKALIVGTAGIGKTTLMHKIAYKWGVGELWNDQFNYVFRVRLRDLPTEWEKNYTKDKGYDLDKDLFACFLYHCLGKQKDSVAFSNLIDMDKNRADKVLLLLDGYDEITDLLIDKDSNASKIINRIFEHYPNIIMTSRPNALGSSMESRFAIQLQNIGFDDQSITQYIKSQFKKDEDDIAAGIALQQFLLSHSALNYICQTPVSLALVCLLWKDEAMRAEFNGDTNLSSLYGDIFFWLAKRYMTKFEGYKENEIRNMEAQEILAHPIIIFMTQLSRKAFEENEKGLINAKLINVVLNEQAQNLKTHKENILQRIESRRVFVKESERSLLPIDAHSAINKFSLLRADGEGNVLVHKNHQFIHLSFQEWLVAYSVKQQLLLEQGCQKADNVNPTNEVKEFITANISKQSANSMLMKFLSGLVAGENNHKLTEAFWNAVRDQNKNSTDGVVNSLKGIKDVSLYLPLLEQAKSSGEIRAPEYIVSFVDNIILQDLTKWEEALINSNYKSLKIIEALARRLNDPNLLEFEVIKTINILSSLEISNEIDSKFNIITNIKTKLQDKNLSNNIAESCVYGLFRMGRLEVISECLDDPRSQIKLVAMDLLSSRVGYSDLLLQKALENLSNIDPFLVLASIKVIRDISYGINFKDTRLVNEIRERLIDTLGNQSPKYKEIVDSSLLLLEKFNKSKIEIIKEMLNQLDGPLEQMRRAIDILGNVVGDEALDPLNTKVTNILIDRKLNSWVSGITKDDIITYSKIITSLGKIGKGTKVANFLLENLFHENEVIRSQAGVSLAFFAARCPSDINMELLIVKLSDDNWNVRAEAAKSLGQIAEKIPSLIDARVVDALLTLHTDTDSGVRSSASDSLGRIAEKIPSSIDARVVDALLTLHTDTDYYVRSSAVRSLGRIAEKIPSLIDARVVDALLTLNTDTDSGVRSSGVRASASDSLGRIAEEIPSSIDARVIDALLTLHTDTNSGVRASASDSLGQITEKIPSLIDNRVVDALLTLHTDTDYYVRSSAVRSLGRIAEKIPSLIDNRVVDALLTLHTDTDSGVRSSGVRSLGRIAEKIPSLIDDRVVDQLLVKLNNYSRKVRSSAAKSLGQIAENIPSLIDDRVVDKLFVNLSDSNLNVRASASDSLGQITEKIPSLIDNRVVDALLTLHTDTDSGVRSSAVRSLGRIAEKIPSLIDDRVVDQLFVNLSDSDLSVRDLAVRSLGRIAEKIPRLEPKVIEVLIVKLSDVNCDFVRAGVKRALGKIYNLNPEIIVEQLLEAKLLFCTNHETINEFIKTQSFYLPETIVKVFIQLLSHNKFIETRAVNILLMIGYNTEQIKVAIDDLVKSGLSLKQLNQMISVVSGQTSNIHNIDSGSYSILLDALTLKYQSLESEINSLITNETNHIKEYSNKALLTEEDLMFIASYIVKYNCNVKFYQDKVEIEVGHSTISFCLHQDYFVKLNNFIISQYRAIGIEPLFSKDDGSSVRADAGNVDNDNSNETPISTNTTTITSTERKQPILSIIDEIPLKSNSWKLTILRNDQKKTLVILESRNDYMRLVEVFKGDLSNYYEANALETKDSRDELFKEYIDNHYLKQSLYSAIELSSDQKSDLRSRVMHYLHKSSGFEEKTEEDKDNRYKEIIKASLGALIYDKLRLDENFANYVKHTDDKHKLLNYKLLNIEFEEANRLQHQRLETNQLVVVTEVQRHDGILSFHNEILDEHNIILEEHSQKISTLEDDLQQRLNIDNQEKIDGINEEIEKLKKELDKVANNTESNAMEINQKIEELATEITQQEEQVNQLKKECEDLPKILELADKYNELAVNIDKLNKKLNEQEQKLLDLDQIKLDIMQYSNKQKELENKIISQEELINELKLQGLNEQKDSDNTLAIERLKEELSEYQRELVDLKMEMMEHQEALDELSENIIPRLNELLAIHDTRLAEETEHQALLSNVYNRSFYHNFVQQLNAIYLASSVVQTDIVENQKKGKIGKVASIIKIIGSYVPMIGFGVKICGAILSSIDSEMQQRMVRRLYEVATTNTEFEKVIRIAGLELVKSIKEAGSKKLDIETLDRPDTLLNKLQSVLGFIIGNLEDIVSFKQGDATTRSEIALSQLADFGQDYINDLVLDSNEAEAIESEVENYGKKHAGFLATVIVSKIYSGSLILPYKGSAQDKADLMLEQILDEYGETTDQKKKTAKEIANAVVERGLGIEDGKTLHTTDHVKIKHVDRVEKFSKKLAEILLSKVSHRELLDKSNTDHHLKEDVIYQITVKLQASSSICNKEPIFKIYSDGRVGINEDFEHLMTRAEFIKQLKDIKNEALERIGDKINITDEVTTITIHSEERVEEETEEKKEIITKDKMNEDKGTIDLATMLDDQQQGNLIEDSLLSIDILQTTGSSMTEAATTSSASLLGDAGFGV